MPRNELRIITCAQRTPEWFAARAGVLTASAADDMMSRPLRNGGEAAARRDLRTRLVVERMTGQPEENGFVSADMQRGIDLEPEARAAYETETGELVTEVGFVRLATLPVGASPDGVVGDWEGGVEIKCPRAANHLKYLRQGGLPAEYVAQVRHTLWVTGATWWDFASYCPLFPVPLRLYVHRAFGKDFDLAHYAETVVAFLAEVDAEYLEVSQLCDTYRPYMPMEAR